MQSNSLLFLLGHYINRKEQYRILFDLLNGFLSAYHPKDPSTIEEKAYRILGQEIVNSSAADKIGS